METKALIAYLCFYMHKMYEEVELMQNNDNYKWDDWYFMGEKLGNALDQIKKKWIDNVIADLKKISLEDLKTEHYMNIS